MKRKFEVCIEEILRKTIIVEAEDEAEAYQMTEDLYKEEKEVLTADNFSEYGIYVEREVTANE